MNFHPGPNQDDRTREEKAILACLEAYRRLAMCPLDHHGALDLLRRKVYESRVVLAQFIGGKPW